jgi:mono/diheme cytochrome c family protein
VIQPGRAVALLCALFTWTCVTFTVGAVRVTTQRPDGSQGWLIPEGAGMESNPVPIDPIVTAKGQSLYRAKCQRCHGVDGNGRGPEADPDHPPGDLTDGRRASRNPDGVMFYKIWNGRAKPTMPAMKTDITRNDVWMLVHYVKSLRK